MQETMDRLLNRREVEAILGLGRTTLYRMAISGELVPRRIRRRLGYLETEVQFFLKSLPTAGKKPTERSTGELQSGMQLDEAGYRSER